MDYTIILLVMCEWNNRTTTMYLYFTNGDVDQYIWCIPVDMIKNLLCNINLICNSFENIFDFGKD